MIHRRQDVTNSTSVNDRSLHFCAFAWPHLSQCQVSEEFFLYNKTSPLHKNNNKSNYHLAVCIEVPHITPIILISTIFVLLCMLSVLVRSSYVSPFPLPDLPSKQWSRRGSFHYLWPASLRPLHPHPPSGMDQWHCPASGGPGLWHTAGALMHLIPPTDAMQHISWFHYSSGLLLVFVVCLFVLQSLLYGIFCSMILLC